VGCGTTDTCGAGSIRFIDAITGERQVMGRFRTDCNEAPLFLTRDPRGPSLEERSPEAFAQLLAYGANARKSLREEMEIEFTLEDGKLWILDAVTVPRSSRAAVRVVVDLANDGVIIRDEAISASRPRRWGNCCTGRLTPRPAPRFWGAALPPAPARRLGGWCSARLRPWPVPPATNLAFWPGAKPRPRIFAACIRPARC